MPYDRDLFINIQKSAQARKESDKAAKDYDTAIRDAARAAERHGTKSSDYKKLAAKRDQLGKKAEQKKSFWKKLI